MKKNLAAQSRRVVRLFALALLGASGSLACAAGSDANLGTQPPTGSGGSGGSDATSASSSGEGGSLGLGGSVTGGGTSAKGDIHVHSLDTLYHFEPSAQELSVIGTFDCVLQEPSATSDAGMHDIAVDKSGTMFGVAKVSGQSPGSFQDHIIVSIDKATGHCQKELVVDRFLLGPEGTLEIRGLSFVPQGTLDANEEALVALEIGGSYLRIDLTKKSASLLGSLDGNGPSMWLTKGADVVSIIGDKTYTTAKRPDEGTDSLAIMDPKTGAILQAFPKTSLTTIGGLAYWGGTLYGFSGEGKVYSIDPKTGVATGLIVNNAPPDVQYHGAGVTTAAPLVIPK
ncbi:MAG: hypothetical protein ABI134_07760 [Byssovorax sp.]